MTNPNSKIALLCGAALVALPSALHAQTAPADATAVEVGEVIVTGSRVVTNGASAPTPVTVVTQNELQQRAASSIPDALNTLPAFAGSNSPAHNAIANPTVAITANNLNLRALGPVRVLTLFDGLRLPPEGATGLVDANLIPQMLIQGVDIITGGASAAYGSDAVSGVVNFRLNKKYDGVGFLAQGGQAGQGDYQSSRFGVVAGRSFMDGRLHLEGSAEHYRNDGIGALTDRPYGSQNCTIVGVNGGVGGTAANPYKPVCGAATSNIAFGGFFNTSPNVPGLSNQLFTSNGTLVPFSGTIVGANVCVQCNTGYHDPSTISLIPKVATNQAFGRADFALTDTVGVFAQGLYGDSDARFNGSTTLTRAGAATQFTIFPTNPYLAPAVAALIPATGIGLARQSRDLGNVTSVTKVKTWGFSAGLDGVLPNGWKWDVPYSYGRSQQDIVFQQINNVRLRAALDAVVDPASGNVVCRVTLTNPGLYPGCAPINMFGEGKESPAALAYIRGVGAQRSVFTQNVVEANLRGDLFTLPAGPISGAVGVSYRRQSFSQTSNSNPADPVVSTGIRGFSGLQYVTANFAVGGGAVNVREGYGEVQVPLLKDAALARSLDLNAAARYTDYSTSGAVTTWKVGLSWEPLDSVRFRVTRSRDIRAPTLVELFQGAQPSQQLVADAHTGLNQGYLQIVSGNAKLSPEEADTATIGLVFKPAFLSGLTASIDYYDISISNAIAQPYTPLQILQLCEASGGAGPICGSIVRPLPFSNRTAANFPTSISVQPLNVAAVQTRGFDVEVDYLTHVGPGDLSLRGLATFATHYTQRQSPLNPVQNILGTNDLGSSAGLPKFKGSFSADYRLGGFKLGLIESVIGALHQSAVTFYVDNDLPPMAYTSLNLSYDLPKMGAVSQMQVFANVDNLFDTSPPFAPAANPGLIYPTYRGLYDVVGRTYTIGVRGKF